MLDDDSVDNKLNLMVTERQQHFQQNPAAADGRGQMLGFALILPPTTKEGHHRAYGDLRINCATRPAVTSHGY